MIYDCIQIKIPIYFHKTLHHTIFSCTIIEFGKECYGSASDCQSEVKLIILLFKFESLLKLDTNYFDMFILARFTELF